MRLPRGTVYDSSSRGFASVSRTLVCHPFAHYLMSYVESQVFSNKPWQSFPDLSNAAHARGPTASALEASETPGPYRVRMAKIQGDSSVPGAFSWILAGDFPCFGSAGKATSSFLGGCLAQV